MRRLRNAVFAVGLLCPAALVVAAEPLARTDLYGDPLPAGAAVRLGTARYRSSGHRTITPLFIDGDRKLIVSGYKQFAVMGLATGKHVLAIDVGELGISEICLPRDRRSAFTLGYDSTEGLAVTQVVSTSSNASIQVLDAITGEERLVIEGVPSLAWAASFSGDGKRLACGFNDGTVLIWDLDLYPKSR